MRRTENPSIGWEAVIAKAKKQECDEAVAIAIIDDIWPYVICMSDTVWNVRQHILDTELGEKNDTKD